MKKIVSILSAICILLAIVIVPATAATTYVYTGSAKPDHLVLSWTADPTTTMTLTWRTDTTVSKSVVEYQPGSSLTAGTKVTGTDATSYKDNLGTENIHRVTLTSLTPGTTYSYRVGDGTNWSAASTFTTEAKNTTSFKFLVYGDAQCGSGDYTPWKTTLEKSYAAFPDANFMVNMGDTAEYGGKGEFWDLFFASSAGVMPKLPEMIVQGNHDTFSAAGPYEAALGVRNNFTTPANGPKTAEGLEKMCYSYDYGKVHFVVLDSQGIEENIAVPGSDILQKEAVWLDTDLAAHKDAQFTVVMMHKCIYYNNTTRANSELKIFLPIFDKFHVDLVLNGHDHEYARTYPMIADSPAKGGTVYITTGRSGEKTYVNANRRVWDAFYYDAQDMPTYNVVSVNGAVLTFNAYKQDGTLLDTYTIDKAGSGTTQTILPAKSLYTRLAVCGDLLQTPELSTAPSLIDGVYYIPLRSVVQHLGGTTLWNSADASISITGLAKPAAVKIGSADATVGGAAVTLKHPIAAPKGITLISIEDVSSLLFLNSLTVFPPSPLPMTARYDATLNMILIDD